MIILLYYVRHRTQKYSAVLPSTEGNNSILSKVEAKSSDLEMDAMERTYINEAVDEGNGGEERKANHDELTEEMVAKLEHSYEAVDEKNGGNNGETKATKDKSRSCDSEMAAMEHTYEATEDGEEKHSYEAGDNDSEEGNTNNSQGRIIDETVLNIVASVFVEHNDDAGLDKVAEGNNDQREADNVRHEDSVHKEGSSEEMMDLTDEE